MAMRNNVMRCLALLLMLCTVPLLSHEYCDVTEDTSVVQHTNSCVQLPQNISDTSVKGGDHIASPEAINMKVNSAKGILEVLFPLVRQCETYVLNLYVNDIPDPECSNSSFMVYDHMHTSVTVNVSNCHMSEMNSKGHGHTSRVVGYAEFRFIYTACYILKVIPEHNKSALHHTQPQIFETSYEKKIFSQMVPTITLQCSPMRGGNTNYELQVIIGEYHQFFEDKLSTVMELMNDQQVILTKWNLALSGDNDLTCRKSKASLLVPKCMLNGGHNDVGKVVKCTFPDLPQDTYTLLVTPQETVRCRYNAVWDPKIDCHFFQSEECEERIVTLPEGHFKAPDQRITYIMVGSVFVCVVLAGSIFIAIRKLSERTTLLSSPLVEQGSEPLCSQPQVLLLYAQDSEPFMMMMTALRDYLKDVAKCKVLDCFDPALTEDIAASPNEWMRHWASHPDVKIVVVASACAMAHQKALSEGIKLQYHDPKPFNHLFLAGLKELTSRPEENYLRVFVARFDDADLSYLTPYARYALPLHVQDLAKRLNPTMDESSANHCLERERIKDYHNELKLFREMNPQYCSNLLFQFDVKP